MRNVLTFAVLAGVFGCSSAGEADGANLIAVLPYTGDFASGKAEHHLNSMTMALEHLIDGGAHEQMGVDFNVIPVNSGNGKDFVQGAVQGILDDHSKGGKRPILGILSSTGGAHEGSAKAAIELGIPHIEVSSGAHDEEFLYCSDFTDPETCVDYTEEQKRSMFSTRALCGPEAQVTADFIAQTFPGARVALFRGDKIHDRVHTNVIRSYLEEIGFTGTVIDSGDAANDNDFILSYETADFRTEIAAAVNEHAPDVIFWHIRGDSKNTQFVKDLRLVNNGAGWDGDSVTCGMARNSDFIDPNANEGTSNYLAGNNDDGTPREGAFYFVMRSPLPGASLDAFKADYRARFGIEPDTFSPSAFDAGMLLGLGVLSAGPSADPAVMREAIIEVSRDGESLDFSTNPTLLVERVASGANVDFDGVSGPLDWRESRIVAGSYYVERVIANGDDTFAYEELASPPRTTR